MDFLGPAFGAFVHDDGAAFVGGRVVGADDDGGFALQSGEAEMVDDLVVESGVLQDGEYKDEEGEENGEGVAEERDHVDESHSAHESRGRGVVLESEDEYVIVAESEGDATHHTAAPHQTVSVSVVVGIQAVGVAEFESESRPEAGQIRVGQWRGDGQLHGCGPEFRCRVLDVVLDESSVEDRWQTEPPGVHENCRLSEYYSYGQKPTQIRPYSESHMLHSECPQFPRRDVSLRQIIFQSNASCDVLFKFKYRSLCVSQCVR